MNNAIFRGQVRHRRFSPKRHFFNYSLYLTFFDLDKIEQFFRIPFIFGCKRLPAFIKFKRDNYLKGQENLAEACRDLVETKLGFRPTGPCFIATNLQYLGICFNPVSFYYCCDENGRIAATIAEINNTPWNERHSYCIDMRSGKTARTDFEKNFHISPFMPMDMNYRWLFNHPREKLQIHMSNYRQGEKIFDATLNLKRQKLTYRSLLICALCYPVQPLKILLAIYWQALRLWLKKTPFYEHQKTEDSYEYNKTQR